MLVLDSKYMYGTDGSGNQKKIWINNYLYKVDSKFRDSTKEVSACNIAEAFGLYHVHYERIKCKIDNTEKWCSVCKSYITNREDTSINLFNILNYCIMEKLNRFRLCKKYNKDMDIKSK